MRLPSNGGVSTWRQRILTCLRQFINLTHTWGQSGAVTDTCHDIAQCLEAQWHETEHRLPLYPVFTGKTPQ